MENIVEHFNGEDEQKKNNGELSKILACSLMYWKVELRKWF